MAENIKTTAEWEQEERAVTLTNREWTTLISYILMTTNYRKGEREAWERLSTEKKEDGSPAYTHAAGNAEFWRDMDATLETIKRAIDAPYR